MKELKKLLKIYKDMNCSHVIHKQEGLEFEVVFLPEEVNWKEPQIDIEKDSAKEMEDLLLGRN